MSRGSGTRYSQAFFSLQSCGSTVDRRATKPSHFKGLVHWLASHISRELVCGLCEAIARPVPERAREERVWSELRVARVAVSPPSCANRATTKTCCAPHDSTIPHAHSVLSKVRNKLGRSRQGRWEKLAAARQGSECRTHVEALLERLECGGTRPFLFAGFHASKRGEGRGAGALRHAARGEATMGALGTY